MYETYKTTFTPTDPKWYVVHCKPSKEIQAAKALQEILGLTVFLPESNRVVKGKVQPSPFFPGYLFIRADLERVNLSSINGTPNVIRLLDFGGRPQSLDQTAVEAIRDHLAELEAHGGFLAHDFQPGDPVWLNEGPLKGLRAVFVGPMTPTARVKVLLDFLGRTNEVNVDLDSLVRADLSGEQPHKHKRGSRGKGRKIQYAGAAH